MQAPPPHPCDGGPPPAPTVFRFSQGSRRAASCKSRVWECDRSDVSDRVVGSGSGCWLWLLVVPMATGPLSGRGCVGSRDRRTPWMAYASLQGCTCSVSREPTHPRPPKPHPAPAASRFPLPASRFPLPASRFPLPASRSRILGNPKPQGPTQHVVAACPPTPHAPAQPRRTLHPALHAYRFGILGKPTPHKPSTCPRSHRHTAVTKTSFHSSAAGETGPYPATE